MITTPLTEAYVRGVAELEPTDRGLRLHRLPTWVREQFPDPQLLAMEARPAGVRMSCGRRRPASSSRCTRRGRATAASI